MCGFAGICEWREGEVSRELVEKMALKLTHRGPDDFGVWAQGAFGVGHTRLAIIDTSSAGRQPMVTVDGRHVLAFNGEIYNYRELAQAYLPQVRLTSSSDTEVLLQLLARGGEDVLGQLRGMFAFAWWDRQREELVLARDPFGKKPLYFAVRGQTIVFGSEIKALLAHPKVLAQPDPLALTQYFLHEYVPAPATGFAGIQQVPMGTVVKISKTGIHETTWWQPQYQPKLPDSQTAAEGEFDKRLTQAVKRRLVADVPVGLLLSGGLDSTTIGWYMRELGARNLAAFSMAFDEPSFDESAYARIAAKALGVEHHTAMFDVESFPEVLEAVNEGVDIPLADASMLPTYALSCLARQEVTVVLDGDGSDELFGGYGTFTAARLADRLPRLSHSVTDGLLRVLHRLPVDYRNFSFDFKLKSFIEGLAYSPLRRNQVWLGSFTETDLGRLLKPAFKEHIATVYNSVDARGEAAHGLDSFDTISLLKVYHYLQNDLLVKLDRATMLHGLEARTPFLDVDVANFVMRLPASYKRNKQLLKSVMRGRIPAEIIDRPKRGFGVPIGFWLRGPLFPWAESVLAPDRLAKSTMLAEGEVARLLAEHKNGRYDHRKKLWTLLMFQLWYERWILPPAI